MKTIEERLEDIRMELLSIGDDLADQPGITDSIAFYMIQSAMYSVRSAMIILDQGATDYFHEKLKFAKSHIGYVDSMLKVQNGSKK